jgi:hypothetical protein
MSAPPRALRAPHKAAAEPVRGSLTRTCTLHRSVPLHLGIRLVLSTMLRCWIGWHNFCLPQGLLVLFIDVSGLRCTLEEEIDWSGVQRAL